MFLVENIPDTNAPNGALTITAVITWDVRSGDYVTIVKHHACHVMSMQTHTDCVVGKHTNQITKSNCQLIPYALP